MAIIAPAFKRDFEEKSILSDINRVLKKNRGFVVKLPPAGSPVILVISGGFDSIILWEILMDKYKYRVWPVHSASNIKGQERSLKFFSRYFQKKYPDQFNEVYKTPLYRPSFSAANLKKKFIFKNLPFMVNNLTFNKLNRRYGILLIGTPTRQFYFNLSAYEYCNRLLLEKGVLIKTVFNGIVPDDAKFARESTLALIRSINLSFNLLFRDFGIQSLSPLEKEAGFYFHKKDLLKYALKAGLPIEKTWSCGKNGWYHCGICPSCRTRISVFEEAGIKDKTIYFVNLISRFKQYLKNSVLFDLYCLFKRKIAIRPSRKNVSVDASSIISINEMVEWYKKEEDIFLLHKKYGDLEVLNESGSFVWEQISSTRKIVLAELTKKLAKKYNLSSKRADNDLKKIIKSLIRKEYLNVSNGQAG